MKAMAWVLAAAGALVWGGAAEGRRLEAYAQTELAKAKLSEMLWWAPVADTNVTVEVPDALWKAVEGATDAVSWLSAAGREVGAEEAYAGALEGVLRAGDPGVKIVSKEEWEAARAEEESMGDEALETEDLPGGFGYAKVRVLSLFAANRLVESLEGWEKGGMAGAVLDLRGARGTAAGAADRVAMAFMDEGELLRESASGEDRVECGKVAPGGVRAGIPVMVLVDGGTRRGAEMLSAELKGSCHGTLLIGQVTAGDPLVREPRALPDGRVALLPARTLKVADGTVYDGDGGVEPDVALSDDDKTADAYEPKNPLTLRRNKRGELEEEKVDRALRERIGTDGFLRRAVDILLGLQAMGK